MPNPVDNEELFNHIRLGPKALVSPGQVTLSFHDRTQKYDIKSADAVGGARSSWKGEELAQFQTSFYIIKDPTQGTNEFDEWDLYAAMIRASLPKNAQPKALDIYHPDLVRNDIRKVSQALIGGMVHDGKGGASVVVKWLEFREPKRLQSTTLTAAQPKPDPNADLKAQVALRRAEAQRP